MIQDNTKKKNQFVTLETLIKKFKKSDLTGFPNVYNYRNLSEAVLWILWVINEGFHIDAFIPASMIAYILVDGIGKSADKNSIIKAMARIGTKVHRRKIEGEPAYKIMKEGITYLRQLETNPQTSTKVYRAGEQYDLYKDIKDILKNSSKEAFIVDSYPDDTFFDLYIDSISTKVSIKILTHNPPMNFIIVGKLVKQKHKIAIVDSPNIHDRYIFVDGRCWMLGSSMKSAGKTKPTTLVEITTGKEALYNIHDGYFKTGKCLV